jgi:hypothetical protein
LSLVTMATGYVAGVGYKVSYVDQYITDVTVDDPYTNLCTQTQGLNRVTWVHRHPTTVSNLPQQNLRLDLDIIRDILSMLSKVKGIR